MFQNSDEKPLAKVEEGNVRCLVASALNEPVRSPQHCCRSDW